MRSVATVFLFVVVLLGTLIGSCSLCVRPPEGVHTPECDPQLSAKIDTSKLCVQLIQITVSRSNPSAYSVPVMIMKPGTSTTFELLYLLNARTVGHAGPEANVTASTLPFALSVPSGTIDTNKVMFSNTTVIYQTAAVIIYRYTLSAADDSAGYYAMLPPYYYGTYPAFAIGADPNNLNESALSIWGYSGFMISQEFIVPSYVVGTGDLNVVNATIPMISYCPNQACNMIAHSQN